MEFNTYFKYKSIRRLHMMLLLLCVLSIQGCDLLTPNPYYQPVAESIDIGPQWSVITPPSPLKVIHQTQSIFINVPDTPKWDMDHKDNFFTSPDGERIKIEMQVVSSDGQSYEMNAIALGSGLEFTYLPDRKNFTEKSRFPQNIVFDKIRIRANSNFTGGEVKWICATNK